MDPTIVAAIIGAIALVIVAVIGILKREPKQKESETLKYYYFLVGCGVGNRIGLVLAVQAVQEDATELNKFIDALQRIGLRGSTAIAPITKARDIFTSRTPASIEKDKVEAVIERFVAGIKKIPDAVRTKSSADEFQWFKFGELLGEVVNSVISEDPERPGSTAAAITALESLIEEMNLPSSLRQDVVKFIQAARTREDTSNLIKSADQIAQIVFSLL